MNKALLAALASVALIGASCSVQDFSTVVMDAPVPNAFFEQSSFASLDLPSYADFNPDAEFAFNYCDDSQFNPQSGSTPFIVKRIENSLYVRTNTWNGLYFRAYLKAGVTYTFAVDLNTPAVNFAVTSTNDDSEGDYQGLSFSTDGTLRYGTFTASTDKNYFRIWLNDNVDYVISNLRICEGSEVKPYFPYYYCRGYLDSSAYEIVKDLSRFEFVYHTGSDDSEVSHTIVKTDYDAVSYLSSYVTNGLLNFRAVVGDLTDGVSGAHDIVARFKYARGKTIDAAPLYIDYEAFTSLVTQEFRTELKVYSQRVQVPWYVFNSSLEVSYQGNLADYSTGLVSDRYRAYTDIQINYPLPDVGGRLNYIGILSGYAQGYADGVSSRDGEVDDLTARILSLEDDLSQYRGKTYQQIYDSGFQSGLDEENQGARTFNSLFGNILSAPLTILNGVSDISFFGMPILTAILSLLMVAFALFLFKRFK